jgi:hypothetical protein
MPILGPESLTEGIHCYGFSLNVWGPQEDRIPRGRVRARATEENALIGALEALYASSEGFILSVIAISCGTLEKACISCLKVESLALSSSQLTL